MRSSRIAAFLLIAATVCMVSFVADLWRSEKFVRIIIRVNQSDVSDQLAARAKTTAAAVRSGAINVQPSSKAKTIAALIALGPTQMTYARGVLDEWADENRRTLISGVVVLTIQVAASLFAAHALGRLPK